MSEQELRELLKLIRGVEHYIEKCLKNEKEKNEDKLKKQLQSNGVNIISDRESELDNNFFCSQCEKENKTQLCSVNRSCAITEWVWPDWDISDRKGSFDF